MSTKVDYVLSQSQIRKHHCHWTGCNQSKGMDCSTILTTSPALRGYEKETYFR